MPFQSALNVNLGFGVVGELFDSSPVRSAPWNLVSSDAANNVVGRAVDAKSVKTAEDKISAYINSAA